ncbi:unnamed protein product [Withania somnifera]
MGLSTKLVSIDDDGLDNWTCSSQNSLPEPPLIKRQPPPKPEPLKCPRCDSINTKFCYYNNYNKSQPRHYCKGCKRHWTEGGTLRNGLRPTDPVDHIIERKHFTLKMNDQMCPLINTTVTSTTTSSMPSVTIRENSTIISSMDENIKNIPLSSSLPYDIFSGLKSSLIPQDGKTHFSLVPNSSTTQLSSNAYYNYEYLGKSDSTMEESTITTVMPITRNSDLLLHQPWEVPETSNDLITKENMSSSYWNWNEFDTFSTAANLNISWDDLEIKP